MNANNLVKHYREKFTSDPNIILDIGCHELSDSIILAEAFPSATILSFEANPELYKICVNRNPYPDRIKIFNMVVMDKNALHVPFHITPGNIGASSMLVPEKFVPHTSNSSYQTIDVMGVRLEDMLHALGIDVVDLIWMDAQGAELLCLNGLGSYLNSVKMIQTEVGTQAYYKGHTLHPEIDAYLKQHDFENIFFEQDWSHEANAVYKKVKDK